MSKKAIIFRETTDRMRTMSGIITEELGNGDYKVRIAYRTPPVVIYVKARNVVEIIL